MHSEDAILSCAICEKRKEKRFCPAVHGRICPQCCGENREITLDCPNECVYLQQARQHEGPRSLQDVDQAALFPQVEIGEQFLYEHQHLLLGINYALVKSARADRALVDEDLIAALTSSARTYETLVNSGLHYEVRIASIARQSVLAEIQNMIKEFREAELKHTGSARLRDSEVLTALVFLIRMAYSWTSGRPKSRAFIDFLGGAVSGERVGDCVNRMKSETESLCRRPSRYLNLFTICPAGSFSSTSRILCLNTGWRTSGAISDIGSNTKRRSCIDGCGMVRP